MASASPSLPLDHCVLPVADLKVARERLSALGFTVAPEGRHPFGTSNACVYFSDGTFLEPLAVGDAGATGEAAQAGNVFVARDRAYRDAHGRDGFSGLAFATGDARADHARYVEAGVSAGGALEFSRGFADAAGRTGKASFRLAFAADRRAPDCFFFACQRVDAPDVDRSALELHANGAGGVKAVVLSARDPAEFVDFVRTVSNTAKDDAAGNVVLAGNGYIELLSNAEMERFGAPGSDGLELRAIIFGVADIAATDGMLAANCVAFDRRGGQLIVQPVPGQGAIFVFEVQ